MTIYTHVNEFCSAVTAPKGADPRVISVETRKPRSPSPTKHVWRADCEPPPRPEDTIMVSEDNDWIEYFTHLLNPQGIDARRGNSRKTRKNASPTGGSGTYVQIYGANSRTDCRAQGMKRIGIYNVDGNFTLNTWGITKKGIEKENLHTWVTRIQNVCDTDIRWEGIDSEDWPSVWQKQGVRGGFTTRFIKLNNMEKSELCDIIKKLIA